ncbi:type II toxin-antitoxin system VapC family toxin [Candidatus Albibeggiatoa sp. nov. BB20]|uniref:type II toxin-antitoxin system VapC family toxin n=1 Tax=Candidatus Albibeggiatoa sp. nov. BB20 TaxID=3162723 RepID=UPI003365543E
MRYLDTSFILPLFVQEPNSEHVSNSLQSVLHKELAISSWVKVEFSSALARRVRMKEISDEFAKSVLQRFSSVIRHYQLIDPSTADFELATELLQNFHSGLRAGDALHLGIVLNRRATLYTLDVKFANVAMSLGVSVKT